MTARLALAASLAVLAFVLGMVWAHAPAPAVPVRPGLRVADLRLEPAGVRAAQALDGLTGDPAPVSGGAPTTARAPLRLGAEVPSPLSPLTPPPVEDQLRRATAAVALEGGRLGLVLAGGRRLHEGDGFQGWRLASVSRSGAVLSRGRERRSVSLFGASPPTPSEGGGFLPATPAVDTSGRVPGGAAPRPPTADEFFRGFKG